MFTEKCQGLFFITFITLCICSIESREDEISKDSFVPSDLDYTFLKNYENEWVKEEEFELNVTESESNELQPADCPCKNGKCVWKGIRKECVCDPEFGKVSSSECRYCDCGRGFNCMFYGPYDRYRMKKSCICTEGYYEAYGSCNALCNSTHPCQNGGWCESGRCRCKTGTMGDFCESIFRCRSECRPRLIVDCGYDQEKETYQCLCKNRSLLFDYNEWVCKECPCGEGTCKYVDRELRCDCKEAYQDFKGRCKKCYCGPNGTCEINRYSGEKTCKCNDEFVAREGQCVACKCGLENIKCNMVNNTKVCDCPKGYEDLRGTCEDINECLLNSTCHPTAKCINTIGSFKCECEEGYKSRDVYDINEACEDIDECFEDPLICSVRDNVKCFNLPGTYKCECLKGCIPTDLNVDPRKTKCEQYSESWLPAGIAFGTIAVLIIVSAVLYKYMDYRARR